MKLSLRKIHKKDAFEFALVTWLVLISGNIGISIIPGTTYLTAILGSLYFLYRRNGAFFIRVIPSVLFFIVIFIGQYFTLKILPLKYPIGFLATIIAGAAIYHLLGERFRLTYLRVIFFFSFVSLFFWGMQNLLGITFDLFGGVRNYRDILLWSVRPDPYNPNILEFRNGGPVWEPGAFAGYIVIAFLLYINDLKHLWRNHRFKLVTILVALLTTFSTAGYVLITIIFFYQIVINSKSKIFAYLILLPVFVASSFYLFVNTDFLAEKIFSQYETASAIGGKRYTSTRMGALLFDLYYISKNPIFGNGKAPETRWQDHPSLYYEIQSGTNLGHGNGFSSFLAEMGVIALLFILINIFRTFSSSYGNIHAIFAIVLVCLLLQTQSFFNHPLMLSFYFISLPSTKEQDYLRS